MIARTAPPTIIARLRKRLAGLGPGGPASGGPEVPGGSNGMGSIVRAGTAAAPLLADPFRPLGCLVVPHRSCFFDHQHRCAAWPVPPRAGTLRGAPFPWKLVRGRCGG
jgi:hypothetical protein